MDFSPRLRQKEHSAQQKTKGGNEEKDDKNPKAKKSKSKRKPFPPVARGKSSDCRINDLRNIYGTHADSGSWEKKEGA